MIPLPPMVRRIQAGRMARRRRWAEAYGQYRAAARAYPDRVLAAVCWQDAAGMAGRLGRYREQAECSRRSLSLLPDTVADTPLVRRTRIRALLALAESLYSTGDLTGGAEAARRVYDLAAGRVPDLTPESFHRLGQALLLQGEIGGALTALAHAAESARAGGTGLEVAEELVSLGVAAATVGDDTTARDCATEAGRLARASTERQRTTVLAPALSLRAPVLRREGRDEEAVSYARESLSLLSDPVGQQDVAVLAQCRERLATCLLACGEPEKDAEAVALLRRNHTEAVEQPLLPGLPAPVLRPLPAAEREARTVAGFYGARALLGAHATREAVLARLPRARFAHFATHALAGEDVLRIPGALCLAPSRTAGPAGEEYPDGADSSYIRADDIQPLDLSGCPLVVLSACETGWGRPSPEGNLGLARAFLAAGVRSVVVALWPVDDTATADLMTAFHRHLVTGATTGEALGRALRETRQQHPRPADWAGFALLGSADTRLTPAARG